MAAVMRGLDAEKYDRQYSDRVLLRRIVRYIRNYPRHIGFVIAATVASAFLNAAPPLLVSRGVALIAEQGSFDAFPWIVGTMFLAGLLVWVANWVNRINAVQAIQGMILDMRSDAFTAAAKQDMSFYDQYSQGRIVSRISNDSDEFGRIVQLSVDLFQQISTALILIVTLFTIDVGLAFAVLGISPIAMITASLFRNVARRVTTQASRALGEVNKSIQEAVTGIGVAKNFRQEQTIYDEFEMVNRQAYDINVRRAVVIASLFPSLSILLGFGTGAILYLGGRAVVGGIIVVATWYLFLATLDRFWFPLINLSSFWSQFQQGLAAVERIFSLIDADPAVHQTDAIKPVDLQGRIEFRSVDFSYNEREQILDGFNLTIEPGQTLAIVGHTGAGKSSISRLVTRFYEFQSGDLLIDDYNIRNLDLSAYRLQLGIVSQVPFLFNGTVADNLRYGRPNATDEEIRHIAHLIGNGEWLDTLPDGLDTIVGERGARLSMGQRQLVALTRVLVANPRIFILDEATANIDPFTESQIQEALQLVMSTRTSIVIAHRLSTVRSADRIIVLDRGNIIESGSHDELMTQKGHYADLYSTYFRHQSLSYIEQKGWE